MLNKKMKADKTNSYNYPEFLRYKSLEKKQYGGSKAFFLSHLSFGSEGNLKRLRCMRREN